MENSPPSQSSAQTTMENQIHSVSGGSTNGGNTYVAYLVTLYAIRGANSKTKDIWIATDAKPFESFDDIVIYQQDKESNKEEVFLLKCRRSRKPMNIPIRYFFLKHAGKNVFNLEKCCDNYVRIIKIISSPDAEVSPISSKIQENGNNLWCVLFTNSDVDEDCLDILEKSNHEFLNTVGEVYSFKYENVKTQNQQQNNSNFDMQYLNRLILLSNQIHNKRFCSFVIDELVKLLHPVKIPRYNLHDVVKNFASFITEWTRGESGKHYLLTKAHITTKLTELLLERYMVQFFTNKSGIVNNRASYSFDEWHSLLQGKNITEISVNYDDDNEAVDLLRDYLNWLLSEFKRYQNNYPTDDWEQEFAKESRLLFLRTIDPSMKHEIYRTLRSDQSVTLYHIYRVLWKIKKIPIILEVTTTRDYEIVLHVLNLSEYTLKSIILNKSNKQVLPEFNISKTFSHLVDLEDDAYKLVLNKTVELQGRPILLKSLLEKQKELVAKIGVREIMQALTDSFNVGDTINTLPVYHVIRTIPRMLIDFQLLSETLDCADDVFVIQCNNKNLFFETLNELDVQPDKAYIVDYEDIKKLKKIPRHYRLIIKSCQSTFLDQHMTDKPIHQLILHDTYNLEWIATKGSIKTINSLKRVLPYTCNSISHVNAQDVLEHFTNQINIISADPGMGKSVLMDYIAQTAPTDVWVLRINLNQHRGYYGSEQFTSSTAEPTKHLHYFNNFALKNQKRYNPINTEIFTAYLNTHSVLLLFDGFDEVPQYYRDNVANMIRSFLRSGYRVWLTTRSSFQTYLERKFGAFALTLNPFSSDDQLQFLTQYFLHQTIDEVVFKETIPRFAKQLLQLAQRNLNDWGQQFTSIPLHTRLLVECFEDDCRNYLKNNTLNTDFNLLDLYTKFTQKKIIIAQEKFGHYSDKMFDKYHQLFSLQVLFSIKDLEDLLIDQEQDKFKDMESEAVELLSKSGIVVKNELTLDFIHRSFAEYFAAKWLFNNCKNPNIRKLIKKIFELEYYITRSVFDQLLAQNCPLHTAIIRQQIDEARALIERTPELLNRCDSGGRLPVHLAAAWGTRHPMPKLGEIIDSNIHKCESNNTTINVLLKKMCVDMKQFPSDDVLELTPSNYAVASDCLSNLNAILSSVSFSSPVSISSHNIKNYIYYSSRYGYEFLIKRILQTYNAKQLPFYINSSLDKTFNRTAMHWASAMGHKNVIELFLFHTTADDTNLIQASATLNNLLVCKTDALEQTPLHLAVENQHYSIISVLLSCGANTNVNDKHGRTPLHLAAHNGNVDILNLLLDQSNIDAQDVDGNTSLHLAALKGHDNIVSILLSKTANTHLKNKCGGTPLHMATMKKRIKTMHHLFNHNNKIIHEVDSRNNTALHLAAEYGHQNAVELLLSLNSNRKIKNAEGKVALHLAAAHGHANIVTLLMPNTDINIRDDKGNTPLHLAALRNHKSTISVLLDLLADVNALNDLGRTALHESTINNSKEVASFLLDNEVDFNARDSHKRTALHLAAKYNSVDVIELLLRKKINVNDNDDDGNTPLHLAVLKGQRQAIHLLLHKSNQSNGHIDININAANDYGRTPLHVAAELGNCSIIDDLLFHGACTELIDKDGNTAADLATINNHINISSIFDAKEDDIFI